jgi:hypothetical protein
MVISGEKVRGARTGNSAADGEYGGQPIGNDRGLYGTLMLSFCNTRVPLSVLCAFVLGIYCIVRCGTFFFFLSFLLFV